MGGKSTNKKLIILKLNKAFFRYFISSMLNKNKTNFINIIHKYLDPSTEYFYNTDHNLSTKQKYYIKKLVYGTKGSKPITNGIMVSGN